MSTSGGGCGSLDKATKAYIFEYQEPATLNQVAPVQNTWYTLLDTTANVYLYRVAVNIEDNDETLNVRIIIDGETIQEYNRACTNSTNYYAWHQADTVNRLDRIDLSSTNPQYYGPLGIYGRSVKIEVRKTTIAGTGNLTGIVMYGVLTAI